MIDLRAIQDELEPCDVVIEDCAELGYLSESEVPVLSFATGPESITRFQVSDMVRALLWPRGAPQVQELQAVRIIEVSDPKAAFYRVHNSLRSAAHEQPTLISDSAEVSDRAIISDSGVIIGANCIIEDSVSIQAGTTIGNGSVIRSGARIGMQALQIFSDRGVLRNAAHLGSTFIGDNVEVGPNAVVDRGIFRQNKTIIGDGTKIGALSNVGHGAHIGDNCVLASGSSICGSVRIGEGVWVGPTACISDGLKIGNSSFIALGSTVFQDVEVGGSALGNRVFRSKTHPS